MTSQDDIIAYMKVTHHQCSYLCYSLSCYYTYHVHYEGSVVSIQVTIGTWQTWQSSAPY